MLRLGLPFLLLLAAVFLGCSGSEEAAVEPAEPPMKLDSMSSAGSAAGHIEKFSVVNPVVVPIDTAWKTPARMVSNGSSKPR